MVEIYFMTAEEEIYPSSESQIPWFTLFMKYRCRDNNNHRHFVWFTSYRNFLSMSYPVFSIQTRNSRLRRNTNWNTDSHIWRTVRLRRSIKASKDIKSSNWRAITDAIGYKSIYSPDIHIWPSPRWTWTWHVSSAYYNRDGGMENVLWLYSFGVRTIWRSCRPSSENVSQSRQAF